jgi:UDP-galactopyranose mutase
LSKKYDFVVVGAGLFGCAFAHTVRQAGCSVLIIDRRSHIAGNAYDCELDGIRQHIYGPHIFHTNDVRLWRWMEQFCTLRHIHHNVRVNFNGRMFSFPVNLLTLSQLWGVKNPQEAKKRLDASRILDVDPNSSAKNRILYHAGEEIYRTFFEGYTAKQWGTDPADLPASIVARVPIRLNFNDSYYFDAYVGMPEEGYTAACSRMIDGCDVELGVDFMSAIEDFKSMGRIVYSGSLDELCGFRLGRLPYRSVRFETRRQEEEDAQGCAIVNYTARNIPFTRVAEYKHFHPSKVSHSALVYEFPQLANDLERYYPINTEENDNLQQMYRALASELLPDCITGGRMGSYRYYDMHQAIAMGISKANAAMAQRDS